MKITLKTDRLSIDPVGTTFHYMNKFFRAIKNEAIIDVRDLLKCGLIDELITNKLFPKTWIANVQVDGYELILEHEKIARVSYPFEWSFSMLKDAAICILNVVEICSKYGYGLNDLHNYNIIFVGCNPIFVDFGSIKKGCSFTSKVDNFIDYNFLPIKLLALGEITFAKRILSDEYIERYLPYLNYSSSLLTKKLIWELYSGNYKNQIKRILNYFGANYNLKFNHLTPEKLKNKILKLHKQNNSTIWGTYHQAYKKNGAVEITPRFKRIIELINKLDVKEVLDVAGNQGLLTRLIKDNCKNVQDAICVDYDENAIDSFYNISKNSNYSKQLYPVHSNLIFPISVNYFEPFTHRMKSELVLALALTHHLILAQEFPIDFIFKQIKALTKKYVFIEFMPLGLWGGAELPGVPEWYTIEWFRNNFIKYFTIYSEEKLEENRILFVGYLDN